MLSKGLAQMHLMGRFGSREPFTNLRFGLICSYLLLICKKNSFLKVFQCQFFCIVELMISETENLS